MIRKPDSQLEIDHLIQEDSQKWDQPTEDLGKRDVVVQVCDIEAGFHSIYTTHQKSGKRREGQKSP